MSNLIKFKQRDNLILLWEVLLDELNVQNDNSQLVSNLRQIFDSNINPFVNKASPQSNLVELNKLFLKQVSTAINRLMPGLKERQNIKKITISDEEIQQPYTIEDIHSFRQTEFEKKLEQQKKDFDNVINPKKPKEVDFTYNEKETKITEMEHLIADTIARRNYELEQIQNATYTPTENAEEWLNSRETSIKTEKIKPSEEAQFIQKKLKHISLDQPHNIIPNNETVKKNVSWNDEANVEIADNILLTVEEKNTLTAAPSLFSKLKQKPIQNNIQTNSNSIKNDFIEDSLQPLVTPSNNLIKKTSITNDVSNDIQLRLDGLYSKMDQLQNMMSQIINLLEVHKPLLN